MIWGVTWASIISLLISACALFISIKAHYEDSVRRQAEQISAWRSSQDKLYTADVIINNASEEPIYNVVVAFAIPNKGMPFIKPGRDIRNSIFVPLVPPGMFSADFSHYGIARLNGMSARSEAEIAFTDAKNRSWFRDARGKLKRIYPTNPLIIANGIHINHASPQEYMGISMPEVVSSIKKVDI